MALVACPECGTDVSDKAATCPKCGVPLLTESKVIVAAPAQAMLLNPRVVAYLDGREVASLKRGELAEIHVDHDTTLSFTAGIRSTEIAVKAGAVTRVQLGWDRISGKLVAQVVEAISGRSLV